MSDQPSKVGEAGCFVLAMLAVGVTTYIAIEIAERWNPEVMMPIVAIVTLGVPLFMLVIALVVWLVSSFRR